MHYDGHVCAVFLRSDERGIFRFHIEMGRGIAAICVFDASLEKKGVLGSLVGMSSFPEVSTEGGHRR